MGRFDKKHRLLTPITDLSQMLTPPFKLATSTTAVNASVADPDARASTNRCSDCEPDISGGDGVQRQTSKNHSHLGHARTRLSELDPHLHCSIIGTCLSTSELRKLLARFLFVRDSSDLEVHHEAVGLASQGGAVAKALHKLLDQRHDSVVQRFAKARDPHSLTTLWEEALRQGEIPGAYWAMLTHRDASAAIRQKVFGEVHMLSHLVGAANRADIRRLVALERDNVELRERLERHQLRTSELVEERDTTIARLRQELSEQATAQASPAVHESARTSDTQSWAALVAVQTERRERAEQAAAIATAEAVRLGEELEHLGRHANALGRELTAVETQLQEHCDEAPAKRSLEKQLHGRHILYVGGRPSSTPAIRELVLRHGAQFQRHDGGLEDRKGLLASGVAWSDLVVFPVDCIDHDSATNLKRLCARQQVPYLALRSASVASLAAALAHPPCGAGPDSGRERPTICIKHG
jgi:Uncharacterized protein conserved in bacteria (DUF2325)